MADQIPTLGELYKGKKITEEEVVAAVAAFMADPTGTKFTFGSGYELDLARTVAANSWAAERHAAPNATEVHKRNAVRTAILLARPTQR